MPGNQPSNAGGRWSLQEIVDLYFRNCGSSRLIAVPLTVRLTWLATGAKVCLSPRDE
jgi:hypothetical protein